MTYINRPQATTRTTSILTVAAIHVAAGLGLVYGFAPQLIDIVKPAKPITFDVPLPPPPQPEPQQAAATAPSASTVIIPPRPIDLVPPTVPVDPIDRVEVILPPAGPVATGNGGTVIQPPLPPEPSLITPQAPRPLNDRSRWVTSADYPGRDLRLGNEGTTFFRLVIGSNGRVQACETTTSSGFASLDKAACDRIVSRARFEPGTNNAGEKSVGTYTGSVRWQIPR